MKTVLVTGGLGNIGRKIMDELLSRGFRVKCLELKNKTNLKCAKPYEQAVEFCWGDITDKYHVMSAIAQVDAVIHTAAILPPFSERKPELARKVNIGGTLNIIEAITTINPNAQLIFASSVSVHGNHFPDQSAGRTVNDPFKPVDCYARHKIECEKILMKSHLDWTVLRISACADEKSRLLDWRNLRNSIHTFLRVNPNCRIEYVHPADVATAMVNSVGNRQAIRKQFFIGGGKQCQSNWRDLNSIRLEMLGLKKPPSHCFGGEGFYTEWLDTEESQRILKFQNHDLNDYRKELKELLKWPRRLLMPIRPLVNRYIWRLVPRFETA